MISTTTLSTLLAVGAGILVSGQQVQVTTTDVVWIPVENGIQDDALISVGGVNAQGATTYVVGNPFESVTAVGTLVEDASVAVYTRLSSAAFPLPFIFSCNLQGASALCNDELAIAGVTTAIPNVEVSVNFVTLTLTNTIVPSSITSVGVVDPLPTATSQSSSLSGGVLPSRSSSSDPSSSSSTTAVSQPASSLLPTSNPTNAPTSSSDSPDSPEPAAASHALVSSHVAIVVVVAAGAVVVLILVTFMLCRRYRRRRRRSDFNNNNNDDDDDYITNEHLNNSDVLMDVIDGPAIYPYDVFQNLNRRHGMVERPSPPPPPPPPPRPLGPPQPQPQPPPSRSSFLPSFTFPPSPHDAQMARTKSHVEQQRFGGVATAAAAAEYVGDGSDHRTATTTNPNPNPNPMGPPAPAIPAKLPVLPTPNPPLTIQNPTFAATDSTTGPSAPAKLPLPTFNDSPSLIIHNPSQNDPSDLRTQITELKAEVEQLKVQQHAPPPQYEV